MPDQAPWPSGVLRVDVFCHGRLVESDTGGNLVVAGHGPIQAALLSGNGAGKNLAQIGFGSNTAVPVPGNTDLSADAYFKPLDGISFPAANQIAVAFSLGLFEALGISLSEYGLLTSDGTLYARRVRISPLLKDSSIQLTGTWTITL